MISSLLAQATGIPQPEPLPLAAPHWLFWTLLIATFLLHVLAMNTILGGSLLAAWSRTKGTGHDLTLFHWYTKILPSAIAATVTLGVAPLLFVQVLYGRLLYTSSVLMGWYWLAVIPLVILVYYCAYYLAFKGMDSPHGKWLIWVIAFLFMVIAFIYTNNMSLMLRPGVFVEKYVADGRGLHFNLDDPMLFPRYLHNLFSAIAVAAMGIALLGLLRRKKEPEFGAWAIRKGAVWFGIATIINIAFGVWYLFSLSKETLLGLMNPSGVIFLMLGIVAGLVAVFFAMQAINAKNPRPQVLGGVVSLIVSLLAMILLRDQLRQIALTAAGFEPVTWVAPDWGPILIFLVLFVVTIVTITWMVMLLVRRVR